MASVICLSIFQKSRHVTKNLTTGITIALKILIEKPKRKYIAMYNYFTNIQQEIKMPLCSGHKGGGGGGGEFKDLY